ncbi:hypothetical protein QO004_001036 [Rhizobium mesoamericanum]|uniref:hypothetical protein n=1 Tax=Rhizobium mesoamericanum TaxID=1079800 RepID=UPI00278A4D67|nr:hypothetical protein [Rhizobium mesoamericanum]MDQ0559258.1 hypothetical protein [Rhizobium mesoamericanum]
MEKNQGARVLACTAVIVPARNEYELGPTENWVVLVRNEIIARARRRMLETAGSTKDDSDDSPKQ